jgi:hypothetical protein
MRCCIAKADEWANHEQKTADIGHTTAVRVKAPLHPPKRTTVPAQGDASVRAQLFDKNGPLQSLPTKAINHPDPLQMWQNL